jgi:hypothetical protein
VGWRPWGHRTSRRSARRDEGQLYQRFPNRDALVAAATVLWERQPAEANISAVDAEADPVARFRMLFTQAGGRAGPAGYVESMLDLVVRDKPSELGEIIDERGA